jgi:hypothetical protein
MKKILEGPSRRVGSIFQEVDTNFIEVCNSILKIAYPDENLIGYAETEPAEPALFDCYLVKEDATIWGIEAVKNEIISWNGNAWKVLPHKITEINAALQFFYFDADKIELSAVAGLAATNVQEAITEITAALVAEGLIVP